MRRQHRLVDRVVDHHSPDVTRTVGVAVREVEEGRAEVVEHPPETRARPGASSE